MKRLKVNGGLRIGPELTPGEYVLQVIVTDNLKDAPKQSRLKLWTLKFWNDRLSVVVVGRQWWVGSCQSPVVGGELSVARG